MKQFLSALECHKSVQGAIRVCAEFITGERRRSGAAVPPAGRLICNGEQPGRGQARLRGGGRLDCRVAALINATGRSAADELGDVAFGMTLDNAMMR